MTVQSKVLERFAIERAAQDHKWGEQNHPDVDPVLMNRPGGCTPQRMADEYEIPTANRARALCDGAARRGQLTWAHIAIEELAEAIESATLQDGNTGTEVIQTGAVLTAWAEHIERRKAAA